MSVAFNTLETLVDRQAVAFIGSVDAEGFPNMKAMLAPRVREGQKVYYITTKAPQRYTDVAYPDGAYLVFGREDAGLPEALLAANQEHCIRMPMRDTCRSLNLSNSVAVGVYEVLRQWDFPELLDHGHLRDYEWK